MSGWHKWKGHPAKVTETVAMSLKLPGKNFPIATEPAAFWRESKELLSLYFPEELLAPRGMSSA